MENNNSNQTLNTNKEESANSQSSSLDKTKFGTLQVLTAAQIVTLLVKSDSTFAGPCGY